MCVIQCKYAIYHLISNACQWNNCLLFSTDQVNTIIYTSHWLRTEFDSGAVSCMGKKNHCMHKAISYIK